MTENIRGIGINTGAVNPYGNPAKGSETKPEEKQPEAAQNAPQNPTVKPEDVLTYMANSAVVVNPKATTRTYDVSKYVTPEQAARIAGFVTSFEDQVAKGLIAINEMEEFEGLSEASKYEIAAAMVQ